MSDSDENPALSETISHLRQTPELGSWFHRRGTDSVAVNAWLGDIDRHLTGSQRRKGDEYLANLLGTAAEFLEAGSEQLGTDWAALTASLAWLRFPRVARDLCELVYAIAGSGCSYGGPNVVLSARMAQGLIRQRTGRTHNGTRLAHARHLLEEHGVFTVTEGITWQEASRLQVKPQSAVYHLPAGRECVTSPYCGAQHKGLVTHLPDGSLPYPQWTPEDDFTRTAIREQRREVRAQWRQRDDAMERVPDLGYLIDGWPPHTDFDETAYQPYQEGEGEDEQEPGAGRG